MANVRSVATVYKSRPTLEGAGVRLKRAFGFREKPNLDPFLLLDDFHSDSPDDYLAGFPWHPHRGIETITYMLEGTVEHGDSMGNGGVIRPGEVQWMTAGSGIIHQEMPKGDERGAMWGFQLWANLPRTHKMMDPRYREITSDMIPEADGGGGVRVRVVCGEVGSVRGPVTDIIIEPEYLDVSVPAGATFSRGFRPGHTVFAYVVAGTGWFANRPDDLGFGCSPGRYFDLAKGKLFGPERLVVFGDGDAVTITAGDKPLRFLLVSGKPLGEPVAWYGPIVMNTEEELEIAVKEYNNGTFIKHTKGGLAAAPCSVENEARPPDAAS
ncbi:MAG: pirin family protein [Spirochaetales bacterium]|nr:pirin family protein [Spirochaetales bacterium]